MRLELIRFESCVTTKKVTTCFPIFGLYISPMSNMYIYIILYIYIHYMCVPTCLRSCTTLALGAARLSRQASAVNLGGVMEKSPSTESEFLVLQWYRPGLKNPSFVSIVDTIVCFGGPQLIRFKSHIQKHD